MAKPSHFWAKFWPWWPIWCHICPKNQRENGPLMDSQWCFAKMFQISHKQFNFWAKNNHVYPKWQIWPNVFKKASRWKDEAMMKEEMKRLKDKKIIRWWIGLAVNTIFIFLICHTLFYVKLSFKMGLFSSIFWFEDSLLCKIALFVLVTFTF